jgi:hypothetical protein
MENILSNPENNKELWDLAHKTIKEKIISLYDPTIEIDDPFIKHPKKW